MTTKRKGQTKVEAEAPEQETVTPTPAASETADTPVEGAQETATPETEQAPAQPETQTAEQDAAPQEDAPADPEPEDKTDQEQQIAADLGVDAEQVTVAGEDIVLGDDAVEALGLEADTSALTFDEYARLKNLPPFRQGRAKALLGTVPRSESQWTADLTRIGG